jgi:hypothetical protein
MFLSGRTGTEIVTRDIALGLLRRGHVPVVYAQELGPLADQLRAASVPVIDDIAEMTVAPDVIHGHHNPSLAVAVARFPNVPAIFVCHDFTAWPEAPPKFPSIRRYVAVDHTVADRLRVESGIPAGQIAIHLNAVDLERFVQSDRSLPDRPARALAYVKHTTHLHALRAACAARGIALDVAGSVVGAPVDAPEALFPMYDLVFSSALSALEAIASGCATIVCDGRGLAGMVNLESAERWRPFNFGVRTLTRTVTAGSVIDAIDRYDARSAREVTAFVRKSAAMADLVDRYIGLYGECIATAPSMSRDAHDSAVALHLQTWRPRFGPEWPWHIERSRLLNDVDEALGRPAHVAAGTRIALGDDRMPSVELVTGFSAPEPWGVWTDAERATMVLRIDSRAEHVDLALHVWAFVHAAHPTLEVDVRANAADVATWSFHDPDQAGWRTIRVPLAPRSNGTVVLEFIIRKPSSPRDAGQNEDSRQLGIALSALEVRAAAGVS